eukprot:CAMPEP_0168177102 /NCGR_PEP_ID=MMETSP0139_2-20121125/8236_1 /TAXON_ID=44445 /ORGANISM="Pseudo-nitzschia australis, Strain 10249 10 AB" /LENGTH=409 /DNA_ID=CAMNT_0008096053 /DNA_START=215 /DNA_END=1444 /DNA_ORIENTATION=-
MIILSRPHFVSAFVIRPYALSSSWSIRRLGTTAAAATTTTTTTVKAIPSSIQDGGNDDDKEQQQQSQPPKLHHPDDFGPIPRPKHLSPSSAMAFKECPQSFLFQYLYKLRQPTNEVLAKGSMCHGALEHVFDLEPGDRTLENLQNLLRVEWAEHRLQEEYRFLFEDEDDTEAGTVRRNVDAEREWGRSALRLLENYYRSEDPRTIRRPNPHKREVWVSAELKVDSSLGVTAPTMIATTTKAESFKVRGIIDRLDIVQESPRKVALKVIDYKSGKAPHLKYSPAMNQKIFHEKFYQLKIYALLMREKNHASAKNNKDDSMDLRYLKLHFLDSVEGTAKPWELDLGPTQEIRDQAMQNVHKDLSQIWTDINALIDKQDPRAFVHCDRPFCSCHVVRDRFVPGTVWERERPL